MNTPKELALQQSLQPQPTEVSGHRTSLGRFGKGNKLGKGNPNNRKAQQLRNALLKSVDRQDVLDVMAAMVKKAKEGDTNAAKIVLDRLFGKPRLAVSIETEGNGTTIEVRRQVFATMFGLTPEQMDHAQLPDHLKE